MQTLSESELLIMQWIWNEMQPVTTAQIIKAFPTRGWKSQTVNTFLARLAEKGFLSVRRIGAQNHYDALILEPAYRAEQTKNFLAQMHGGSVRNMIATLCNSNGLQESELEELRRWLQER